MSGKTSFGTIVAVELMDGSLKKNNIYIYLKKSLLLMAGCGALDV